MFKRFAYRTILPPAPELADIPEYRRTIYVDDEGHPYLSADWFWHGPALAAASLVLNLMGEPYGADNDGRLFVRTAMLRQVYADDDEKMAIFKGIDRQCARAWGKPVQPAGV